MIPDALAQGIRIFDYWHMTPAEINATMRAYARRLDTEAWVYGQYARLAFCAKKYPSKPQGEREEPHNTGPMSPEEIKNVLLGLNGR